MSIPPEFHNLLMAINEAISPDIPAVMVIIAKRGNADNEYLVNAFLSTSGDLDDAVITAIVAEMNNRVAQFHSNKKAPSDEAGGSDLD